MQILKKIQKRNKNYIEQLLQKFSKSIKNYFKKFDILYQILKVFFFNLNIFAKFYEI